MHTIELIKKKNKGGWLGNIVRKWVDMQETRLVVLLILLFSCMWNMHFKMLNSYSLFYPREQEVFLVIVEISAYPYIPYITNQIVFPFKWWDILLGTFAIVHIRYNLSLLCTFIFRNMHNIGCSYERVCSYIVLTLYFASCCDFWKLFIVVPPSIL